MEQRPETRSVQPDMPATPDVETREETIARLAGEDEAVARELGGSPDPSARRGVTRTVWTTIFRWGAIGAAAGAVLGIIFSLIPGPREEGRGIGVQGEGVWHTVGYALVMAVAVAIVAAMVAALLTLEREDGRVEREVEHTTGRGPEGPGSPSSPSTDLDPR
ncbi:hypothetical protein [Miltoncostaea marina]|uniref:hypothetical protein n=1 Tax=Miltoncostaea marina TaxID=2843215 RepID=UPI001C3CFF35|nr:hypothetical protein [Miltoncostaea marina]